MRSFRSVYPSGNKIHSSSSNRNDRSSKNSVLEYFILLMLSVLCIIFVLLTENILNLDVPVTSIISSRLSKATVGQLPIDRNYDQQQKTLKELRDSAVINDVSPPSLSQLSLQDVSVIVAHSATPDTTADANLNRKFSSNTLEDKLALISVRKILKIPSTILRQPINDLDPRVVALNPPFEKYIKLIPGTKTGIRQDRRVTLPKGHMMNLVRPPGSPSMIYGKPRGLLAANEVLKNHPLRRLNDSIPAGISLEDIMVLLQIQEDCLDKPIFLTMATVGDELYWQLIENFVYSMVKFNTAHCSLIICVTDSRCMRMCEDSYFPCYDYRYELDPMPSVMEQIAVVKLVHIPKALSRGVDVFMLDLDVGFLQDPMQLVTVFRETPLIDIFVQEDFLFIMNRSKVGWKTWFTEPLPNIGLFLVRGNTRTAEVFSIAWGRYQKMENTAAKRDPGKDQNHVLEGMRVLRAKKGLRYAYFSNNTAVLLDKMCKFNSKTVELGGEVSMALLAESKSVAMHTTCYEKSTKVMGLKATNAFWNPKYYDSMRPTLTKQLLYISDDQILEEIRSLVWLAKMTGRSVILPNLLGSSEIVSVEKYAGHNMWPGFRVSFFKKEKGFTVLKIDVLEPAYYWRIQRDYDEVPSPEVLFFDPDSDSLENIREQLASLSLASFPRVVLHAKHGHKINYDYNSNELKWQRFIRTHPSSGRTLQEKLIDPDVAKVITRISMWANHSVGYYESTYEEELNRYGSLPSLKNVRNAPMAKDVFQGLRNCMKIFGPLQGNRTCFQICD